MWVPLRPSANRSVFLRWFPSCVGCAKLAADGPSDLAQCRAQVIEQVAVRAHLPQQCFSGLGGCVEALARDEIRPLPGRVLQCEVHPQLFQQLDMLVRVSFEIKRVDLSHSQLELGRTRHRSNITVPYA